MVLNLARSGCEIEKAPQVGCRAENVKMLGETDLEFDQGMHLSSCNRLGHVSIVSHRLEMISAGPSNG